MKKFKEVLCGVKLLAAAVRGKHLPQGDRIKSLAIRMCSLCLAVLVVSSSVVPSLAVYDMEIPACPSASEDTYPYWIIFRHTALYNRTSYTAYSIVFSGSHFYYNGSSYACTSSYSRYTWAPLASTSTSWGAMGSGSSTSLSASSHIYIASNYDVMSSSSVYHAKKGNSAFLSDLSAQFPDTTFDPSVWNNTRRIDSGGDGGGGSFDDSGILAGIRNVVNSLSNIPTAIVNGLKDALVFLFVPGDDYFSTQVDGLKTSLEEKLPIESVTSIIDTVRTASAGEMPNVEIDYMGVHGTIVNFDTFRKHKATINSWIRGFMFVLLAFYWIDQLYKLIRGTTLFNGSGRGSSEVPGQQSVGKID